MVYTTLLAVMDASNPLTSKLCLTNWVKSSLVAKAYLASLPPHRCTSYYRVHLGQQQGYDLWRWTWPWRIITQNRSHKSLTALF